MFDPPMFALIHVVISVPGIITALCARMDETVPPSEITVEGGKGYSHGRAG